MCYHDSSDTDTRTSTSTGTDTDTDTALPDRHSTARQTLTDRYTHVWAVGCAPPRKAVLGVAEVLLALALKEWDWMGRKKGERREKELQRKRKKERMRN